MGKLRNKLLALVLGLSLCASVPFAELPQVELGGSSVAYAAQAISAPTITVKASGYDAISVSWGKISGAKNYKVYRATSKTGTYKRVITTSKTSYKDKKIDQNRYYYYKVKAVSSSAASGYSSVKSAKINTKVSLSKIKDYSGSAYVEVNNNIPKFSERMLTTSSYEKYANLDSLGRCGVTIACIGQDLMPTEDRESIGMIKPSGWHTVRYDDLVDGKYLYNRCHLIGYQLTGENANEKNLITGTRYLNIEGMLPFENEVADYVEETGNHVLYRVTPIFSGKNLLASGVQMEAYSVEDSGAGVCFNVYCYNVQPGIKIDYATGDSYAVGKTTSEEDTSATVDTGSSSTPSGSVTFVLNNNTKKFHRVSCSSVKTIKAANREDSTLSRDKIISQGYDPCKRCNP